MEPKSKTQYQHYIPQFLLRRFALAPSGGRRNVKKRNKKQKGNEVLNVVSLVNALPEISTVLVKRTFGQPDMYKDDLKSSEDEQMRIERKLGDIERAASRIIARVADAHKAGKYEISLSRNDEDVLRKFLFVMKYRSPDFFRKFNHQTVEEYDSDDRDAFLEYMRANNIKRPLDVWFDNLIKIIDISMDPAGDWTKELFNSIYAGDALWISTNFWSMYLAFVTPADPGEEFLLAENAFNIQEGHISLLVHSLTGEQKITASTEFHVLSVISPHLAMILRHNCLPEPLEDRDKKVRDGKKEMLAMQAQVHYEPDRATSSLQDLPIAKARNSYTVVRNRRVVLHNGADGVPSAADAFNFIFFRLKSDHIQSINAIMLGQAHGISTLVFKSKTALRRALEFFFSSRIYDNSVAGLKTISERQNEPTLLFFQKLEYLAHSLGSDVRAKYHFNPLMDADGPTIFDQIVFEVLRTLKPILLDSPLVLPMTVLVEVSDKSKLKILELYALDLIQECDGQPSYPDLIFKAVQLAGPVNLNQHTKELFKVELETWRLGWKLLVLETLRDPGADLNQAIKFMRGTLAGTGVGPSSEFFAAPARPLPQHASQIGKENSNSQWYAQLYDQLYGQPPENKGVKAATKVSGFSKQGLSKAFDNIGRDIQAQDASLLGISESPKTTTKVSEFSKQGLSKAFDNIGRDIQAQDASLLGISESPKTTTKVSEFSRQGPSKAFGNIGRDIQAQNASLLGISKSPKITTKVSGFSKQGMSKAFDNIGRNIQAQDASLLGISESPKTTTKVSEFSRQGPSKALNNIGRDIQAQDASPLGIPESPKTATKVSGFSKQGPSKAFDNIGCDIQAQDASLLGVPESPKPEASARRTNSRRNVARQRIQTPQLGYTNYVGETFSTGPVRVRDVDAPSNSLPVQNAVLFMFLFGLFVWYYFSW